MKNKIIILTFMLTGINCQMRAAQVAQVSDAHGAEILLELNEGEIDASQLASRRAENADVKAFARIMVKEHKTSIRETKKVAKQNNIRPDDNSFSEALEDAAENAYKDLKAKNKGIDFDRAYISHLVLAHEKSLNQLDNTLIPSAGDPEYKAHLEKTRNLMAEHLSRARQLQTQLQ